MGDVSVTPARGTDEAPVTPLFTKAQRPYRPRETPAGRSLPPKTRKSTEAVGIQGTSIKAFAALGVPRKRLINDIIQGCKTAGMRRIQSKVAPWGKPEGFLFFIF